MNQSLAEAQAQEATALKVDRGRFLLTKIFSFALICVIGVFVTVLLLSFSRLIDFRTSLTDITQKSVPNMVFSGRVFNQVNTLIYLTEGLSKPTSEAALAGIERNIDMQMEKLKALAEAELADPYLSVQLEALKIELIELKALVRLKLQTQSLLKVRLDNVYQLYDRVLFKHGQLSENPNWTLLIADAVAMAGKVTTMTRMYSIRETAEQIDQTLASLPQELAGFPTDKRRLIEQLNASLKYMLLGRNGVIELRIEQLRIDGRARGRGNFVRNLILDYANLAEYHSYEVNESVIDQANSTTASVDDQIKLIGIVSVAALLFLLSVVVFLQTKFIRRLKLLDKLVRHHLDGKPSNIVLSGNDEISDIANTFNSFVAKIEHQNEILQNLSLSDGLTGIANRRALDERLAYTLNLGQRHLWPTTIMLLDVDFFKRYNDKYGHAKGDECLVEVAAILSALMRRENDFVARYGGEEFVCVLGDTHSDGGHKVAEKIIAAMAKHAIKHGDSDAAEFVTLSIGLVTYYPSMDTKPDALELLKKADKALYRAKDNGRNTFITTVVK